MMHHVFWGCMAAVPLLYLAGFGWLAVQGPAAFLLIVGGLNGWANAGHVVGWTPMTTIFGLALVVSLRRIVFDVRELLDD